MSGSLGRGFRWTILTAVLLSLVGFAEAQPPSPALRIGYVTSTEVAGVLASPGPQTPTLRLRTAADAQLVPTPVRVQREGAFLHFFFEGLEPSTGYRIEVTDEREATIATGKFLTAGRIERATGLPPAVRLTVVGGFPSAPEPADLELAAAALQAQPGEVSLWLGGVVAPPAESLRSAHAYTRAAGDLLASPLWRDLWSTGAHFGVLGANDYGPLAVGRHWSNRAAALEAFAQGWPTPNRPLAASPATYESVLGDVAIFALDGFSFADGVETEPARRAILGEEQLAWLANALAASPAAYKLILCGRPLLPPREDGVALQSFARAQKALLEVLDGPGTEGVVLLTAGGPSGELTRYVRAAGYPLYELSVGPLARSRDRGGEPEDRRLNYFRVPGTLVREPHFATLEFSGPPESRILQIVLRSLDGTEQWSESIPRAELTSGDPR